MMRYFYKIIASAGLALVLIPSLLHYMDIMGTDQMKTLIFLGTMLWFAGAIPWLGSKKSKT
jgi:hypothetical protein